MTIRRKRRRANLDRITPRAVEAFLRCLELADAVRACEAEREKAGRRAERTGNWAPWHRHAEPCDRAVCACAEHRAACVVLGHEELRLRPWEMGPLEVAADDPPPPDGVTPYEQSAAQAIELRRALEEAAGL